MESWIVSTVDDIAYGCTEFTVCEVWSSKTSAEMAALFKAIPLSRFKSSAYKLSKCSIHCVDEFSDVLAGLDTHSKQFKLHAVILDGVTAFNPTPLHQAMLRDRIERLRENGVCVIESDREDAATNQQYKNQSLDRYITSISIQ